MALTTLSKVFLGAACVVVVGATGNAIYKIAAPAVKQHLAQKTQDKAEQAQEEEQPEAVAPPVQHATQTPPSSPNPGKGALGSEANPLKVSIVSFHGYAPALVANRGLVTQPGSIFAQKNINVQFLIQDDVPTLASLFESNVAHCAWRTSDSWASDQPNLRNADHDGKAIMIVDNTQGADAIITNNPSINSIEDLADHTVALLQYTPSHGLLLDAIDNSSLSGKKKNSIKPVFVKAEEGTSGVRAIFTAKNADAAVLWDPDLSLALQMPGSKVIYSTKTASNLIYDVMVCNQKLLSNPANDSVFQSFVSGWFAGIDLVKQKRTLGVKALIQNEKMFELLAAKEGNDFVAKLFDNLLLTGLEDNVRILGLAGGTNYYEMVYQKFDDIYRSAGALSNPKSPRVPPQDSFDYRFVKNLLALAPSVKEEAKKPQQQFSEAEKTVAVAAESVSTKPVLINFASGSADLNKATQRVIDKELVPLIESNGGAYFGLSGNTDSTGNAQANAKLSLQRATAVLNYLKKEWELDPVRFKVSGNGSSFPLCNEQKPEDSLSLEECRARNRTTRVSVFAKR